MTSELRPLDMPSGFRFHPTDEELVMDYLCRKCASQMIPAQVITEVDLYKYDPWQLPAMASYGEKEWYFFSPRDRKYPRGSRPNRAAGNGYWKATGADKPIGRPQTIAIKKALVFFSGKPNHAEKTNWIMHEYRLANVNRAAVGNLTNSKLDEWVLCRLYNKKGVIERHCLGQNTRDDSEMGEPKPNVSSIDNPMPPLLPPPQPNNFLSLRKDFLETSDSLPKLHTDSSGSELMASLDFMNEKEVQSLHMPPWRDWSKPLDSRMDDMGDISLHNDFFTSPYMSQIGENLPSHDIFSIDPEHLYREIE